MTKLREHLAIVLNLLAFKFNTNTETAGFYLLQYFLYNSSIILSPQRAKLFISNVDSSIFKPSSVFISSDCLIPVAFKIFEFSIALFKHLSYGGFIRNHGTFIHNIQKRRA